MINEGWCGLCDIEHAAENDYRVSATGFDACVVLCPTSSFDFGHIPCVSIPLRVLI